MKNLLCPSLIIAAWSSATAQTPRPARIIGGSPVYNGKYPFYCVTSPGALCGCSLIHPDVIITAAHCRGHFGGTNIYIGGIYANRTDAKEVIKAGSELVHPNFDQISLNNDVMLVSLTRRSTLPTLAWNTNPHAPKLGEVLTAIGMGKTSSTGSRAETLLEVDIPVTNSIECSQKYTGITPNMFCAGGIFGKDSCFGDSGSPILNANGLMVGVVSFGPTGGCGVYARTSTSTSFIQQGICELSKIPPPYCYQQPVPVYPQPAPAPAQEPVISWGKPETKTYENWINWGPPKISWGRNWGD